MRFFYVSHKSLLCEFWWDFPKKRMIFRDKGFSNDIRSRKALKTYRFFLHISTNRNGWEKKTAVNKISWTECFDIGFDKHGGFSIFCIVYAYCMNKIHRNRIDLSGSSFPLKLIKWVNHSVLISNENDSKYVGHKI